MLRFGSLRYRHGALPNKVTVRRRGGIVSEFAWVIFAVTPGIVRLQVSEHRCRPAPGVVRSTVYVCASIINGARRLPVWGSHLREAHLREAVD